MIFPPRKRPHIPPCEYGNSAANQYLWGGDKLVPRRVVTNIISKKNKVYHPTWSLCHRSHLVQFSWLSTIIHLERSGYPGDPTEETQETELKISRWEPVDFFRKPLGRLFHQAWSCWSSYFNGNFALYIISLNIINIYIYILYIYINIISSLYIYVYIIYIYILYPLYIYTTYISRMFGVDFCGCQQISTVCIWVNAKNNSWGGPNVQDFF